MQISVDTGQAYFARVPHQKIIHVRFFFFFFPFLGGWGWGGGGFCLLMIVLYLTRAKTLIGLLFDQDLLF